MKKRGIKTQKSVLNMASSDSHINKSQHGRPNRAELPDGNINTARKVLILRELLLVNFLRSARTGTHGPRL